MRIFISFLVLWSWTLQKPEYQYQMFFVHTYGLLYCIRCPLLILVLSLICEVCVEPISIYVVHGWPLVLNGKKCPTARKIGGELIVRGIVRGWKCPDPMVDPCPTLLPLSLI